MNNAEIETYIDSTAETEGIFDFNDPQFFWRKGKFLLFLMII